MTQQEFSKDAPPEVYLEAFNQLIRKLSDENRKLSNGVDVETLPEWIKWKRLIEQVEPPVEPGILRLCIILNVLGFPTTGSCQGHLDHGCPFPWVHVEFESWERYFTLAKIISATRASTRLLSSNYSDPVTIRIEYPVEPHLFGIFNYEDRVYQRFRAKYHWWHWKRIALDTIQEVRNIRCLCFRYSIALMNISNLQLERNIIERYLGVTDALSAALKMHPILRAIIANSLPEPPRDPNYPELGRGGDCANFAASLKELVGGSIVGRFFPNDATPDHVYLQVGDLLFDALGGHELAEFEGNPDFRVQPFDLVGKTGVVMDTSQLADPARVQVLKNWMLGVSRDNCPRQK